MHKVVDFGALRSEQLAGFFAQSKANVGVLTDMRAIESVKEVAAALGLTLSAAKRRVTRERQMLRAMLDRCCRFEFDRRGRVIEAVPRSTCSCWT